MQGYGVIETGWTRSELMQPTIELAKASNTLNKLTFVLLYATDFADRLEKEIIPALKAGFIVLSDRYVYTAMARAGVRGVDRTWMRNLYGFAIAPHQVFYLKIDEKTLIRRVLQSRGMDFWESGMDMKLGDDIYESFRAYQRSLLQGVRLDGRRVRLSGARRKAEGGRHPGRTPPSDWRIPGRIRHGRSGGHSLVLAEGLRPSLHALSRAASPARSVSASGNATADLAEAPAARRRARGSLAAARSLRR